MADKDMIKQVAAAIGAVPVNMSMTIAGIIADGSPNANVSEILRDAAIRALSRPNKGSKREQGAICENCQKPVEVGQVVLPWNDVGEMHADCEHPFSLNYVPGEGDPAPVILVGEPMVHVPLAAIAPIVLKGTQEALITGMAATFDGPLDMEGSEGRTAADCVARFSISYEQLPPAPRVEEMCGSASHVEAAAARYHFEGETSIAREGPRWRIWDGLEQRFIIHGIPGEDLAKAFVDRLNGALPTFPGPTTEREISDSRHAALYPNTPPPSLEAVVASYWDAHEDAREMGYPSMTEALESLSDFREQRALARELQDARATLTRIARYKRGGEIRAGTPEGDCDEMIGLARQALDEAKVPWRGLRDPKEPHHG